jgi:hypothetical protein
MGEDESYWAAGLMKAELQVPVKLAREIPRNLFSYLLTLLVIPQEPFE